MGAAVVAAMGAAVIATVGATVVAAVVVAVVAAAEDLGCNGVAGQSQGDMPCVG